MNNPEQEIIEMLNTEGRVPVLWIWNKGEKYKRVIYKLLRKKIIIKRRMLNLPVAPGWHEYVYI